MRNDRMRISRLFNIFIILLPITLGGCSPFYVMRAAYEESKILLAREDIEDVITGEDASPLEKHKLALVLESREYAKAIGLTPGESFTKYSRVDKDVLVWVMLAATPDAFRMYSWWYPIVGTVPYKGYFDKEDALEAAKELEDEGFETWVRGSEAFSTLGWFNDPVLSTTVKHKETQIVNTVLHETVHSTVWIPGHVDFNESMANFLGFQATVDFYLARLEACDDKPAVFLEASLGMDETQVPGAGLGCYENNSELLQSAQQRLENELALSHVIGDLYSELDELYKSEKSREEKLKDRVVVFESHLAPLRSEYPQMKILQKINNAEILQLRLYLTQLDKFGELYEELDSSWPEFLGVMNRIKDSLSEDSSKDPFQELDWELARIRSEKSTREDDDSELPSVDKGFT